MYSGKTAETLSEGVLTGFEVKGIPVLLPWMKRALQRHRKESITVP